MLKPEPLFNAFDELEAFQSSLVTWFAENGQIHPWRETVDPWAILISEIMLQQTTVAAVRANRRFEKFMAEFPTVLEIQQASEEQLLKAWEGLGYYNRVRNLQKTAISVIEKWGGAFPTSAADLETLPGVGPYSAGAVASFAFNEPAPIVDGNVARVLSRLFNSSTEIDSTAGKKQLWKWAGDLLDRQRPRLFNSALMEVGQIFCRPQKPDCLACPVAKFCQTSDPESLPRKKAKTKAIELTEHALFVRRAGKILLAQEKGSRRKGFYRLPLRSLEEVADLELLQSSKYAITKYRVMLHLYQAAGQIPGDLNEGESWFTLAQVEELPMPSPDRKALNRILG